MLPVAEVLGIALPEAEYWKKERARKRRMQEEQRAEMEELGRRYQALNDRGIDPFARLLGTTSKAEPRTELTPSVPFPIRWAERRVGRNDPCPCGSGK